MNNLNDLLFFKEGVLTNTALAGWFCLICLLLITLYLKKDKHQDPLFEFQKKESLQVFEIAIVLILLALAFCLRLHNLTDYPVQLHNDEMSIGLAVRKWMADPLPYFFGTSWAGLPEISYLYSGFSMILFEDSLWGLRFGSVIVGTLSLLGSYLFLRYIFGKTPALILLALNVPFHWAVHLSRTGHHYVQTAFFVPWSLLLFLFAINSRRLFYAAIAGAFTALAVQSYFASRSILVIEFLYFAYIFLVCPNDRKWLLKFGSIFLLTLFLVLVPSIVYLYYFPAAFSDRTASVVITNPQLFKHLSLVAQSTQWSDIITYQLYQSFGLFHWSWDKGLQYGYLMPFASGILYWPLAVAFIFGLFRIYKKRWFLVIIPLLVTIILGNVITVDPPFSPRLAGIATLCLIPVAVLLSMIIDKLFAIKYTQNSFVKIIITGLLVFFFVSYSLDQYDRYFVKYDFYNAQLRRDTFLRYIYKNPTIKALVNLYENKEDNKNEAYQFMTPSLKVIEGYNLQWADITKGEDIEELLVVSDVNFTDPSFEGYRIINHGTSKRKNKFNWYHLRKI